MLEDVIKQHPPLYQQVYDAVKNSILVGDIPPGSKIVVSKLAEKLGVSRTPLREALRQLQIEGLLIQDLTGSSVTSISQQDFNELCLCRLILEKELIKLVVHNLTTEQIAEAEEVINQTTKLIGTQKNMELIKLNTKFHEIIISACPNTQLRDLLNQVRSKLLLYRSIIAKDPEVNKVTTKEHMEILEAIKERNEEKAILVTEKHLLNDQIRGNLLFKSENQ